jgi:hypothetical protein
MGARAGLRGRASRAAVVVMGVIALVACQPTPPPGPRVAPLDPSLEAGILTPEGSDSYGISVVGDLIEASAPATNTGTNTRVAFWRVADPVSLDQETCATWLDYPASTRQLGAVLRARSSGGRTVAITVTNNIIYWARWGFNVHVMDSAMSPPFQKIGGFELREVFYPNDDVTLSPPHPWRMCARVVGDVVSFIVWPLSHPQPAWGDPLYGGSVTLPEGWGDPGKPGWYVGHLSPGEVAGFGDLTTADLAVTEPPPEAEAVAAEARDPTWIAQAP